MIETGINNTVKEKSAIAIVREPAATMTVVGSHRWTDQSIEFIGGYLHAIRMTVVRREHPQTTNKNEGRHRASYIHKNEPWKDKTWMQNCDSLLDSCMCLCVCARAYMCRQVGTQVDRQVLYTKNVRWEVRSSSKRKTMKT